MMPGTHRRGRGDGMYSRRLLFALLSALVPGAGQVAAGARRRGLIMLAVVAALLICGVVLALKGVDQALSYAVRPRVLLALMGFNVLLLAFRLFAVIDAYRVGGVGGSGAGGGGAHHAGSENPASAPLLRVGIAVTALTLLLVLTAAPHGIAGYYTYSEYVGAGCLQVA